MAQNNKRFENDEKKSIFIALIISGIVIIAVALTFVALIKHKKNTGAGQGTVSSVESSVSEIEDGQEVIVTTQEELDQALSNNRLNIVIRTELEQEITIEEGSYPDTLLIVDAPFTTVINNAFFGNIIINQIAANTWEENGNGNKFYINSATTHIIVGEEANVSTIENVQYYSTLAMEVYGSVDTIMLNAASSITSIMIDGSVGELIVYTQTNLSLSGKTAQFANVTFESGSGDSIFTSSVKTIGYVYTGIEAEFLEGAENSQLYVYSSNARNVISNNTGETVSIIPSNGETVQLEAGNEHVIEASIEQEPESNSSESSSPVASTNNGTRTNTGNGVSADTKTNLGPSSGSSGSSTNTTNHTSSNSTSKNDTSGNNPSGNNQTDKSILDYIKSLFTKVEDLEKNIKKLTSENEELKEGIEAITQTIKIVGYPKTRAVVNDISEYAGVLPDKLYANLENGGIESVDVSWSTPTKVSDTCYKSIGTVKTALFVPEDISAPVAYLYLIGSGYEFTTENRNVYTVIKDESDVSGNDSEKDESDITVLIDTKPEKLYIIVNNPFTDIAVGKVKTSDIYRDRYLFPLTNESTNEEYKVKLYFYYFGEDQKQISSLGNNRFLEHSGEAITLSKAGLLDTEEQEEEAKEPITPIVTPSKDQTEEPNEEPVESVLGAYWDPGKLEYKYCVVEVEIIK